MIAILNCGSSKVPMIEMVVDEFMDYITIPFLEFSPEKHPNLLGIIISGAPILITEMNMTPFLEKSAWIKTCDIPILGICFGHQIIGLQHGAFASVMREDRDWQEIELLEKDLLFAKMPTTVDMMQDHCEAISIPPNFTLLCSSDVCVNEGMKHNLKPLYGVQFHPEVSGNMGRVLIENFIGIAVSKKNGQYNVHS